MRRPRQVLGSMLAAVLLAGSGLAGVTPLHAQDKSKQEKKGSKSQAREPRSLDTREVVSRVLRNFKDGFEALSPSTLRDWVLEDKFYDYPRFEEGVTVFLRSVGEMRVFTREVNVQVEGGRAVMLVDAEMVFASRHNPAQTERRRQQITFDFQRTPEGWLITEINPRSFFLP